MRCIPDTREDLKDLRSNLQLVSEQVLKPVAPKEDSDFYEQNSLVEDPEYAVTLNRMKRLVSKHVSSLAHTFGEFGSD